MIDTISVKFESQPMLLEIPTENQKELLKDCLHNRKCKITFTKVDGSERVMIGSLLPEFVDPIRPVEKPIQEGETPKAAKPDNPNLLVLVDTEINAWRSIKIDSITRFEVLAD